MLESGIQVGRVAGIKIRIHYTWLIILFLMNTSLYAIFRQQLPDWGSYTAAGTAFTTSIVFFISIILHELGHSIVALRSGIAVRSITLFIFGGVAMSEKEASSPAQEFKIAIAGPLVSLALAGIFLLLRNGIGNEGTPLYVALDWLATINFMIGIFNMIPGFPLDGGRVFRAIVWGVTGDEARGMKIAVGSGRLVAYVLMAMGLLNSFQTGNIISGIWMIGIGWFLLSAAESSLQAFRQSRIFSHIGIQSLMETNIPRIASGTSIADWISGYVLPHLQRSALVEHDTHVTGIVSLSDTRKLAESEWSQHSIDEIMTPMSQVSTVTIDSSIEDVLRTMQSHSINQVPITDDHRVVGWVNRESLLKALAIYSESHRD